MLYKSYKTYRPHALNMKKVAVQVPLWVRNSELNGIYTPAKFLEYNRRLFREFALERDLEFEYHTPRVTRKRKWTPRYMNKEASL